VTTPNLNHSIDLNKIFIFAERLRKEAIGDPIWNSEKHVYEYSAHNAKVVAILKLMRAAQGVNALSLLCRAGLFIGLGVIIRCVHESVASIYFLLEEYPKSSNNIDQFVKSFFENTIEGFLSVETHSIPMKKIRSAVVRVLKDSHDQDTYDALERIFVTFSGYVHANYAHIMETYGGPSRDFNLPGIPSYEQRLIRMEAVELAGNSVLHATAFIAQKLNLRTLSHEIVQSWQ
jgi:hypothetical protein